MRLLLLALVVVLPVRPVRAQWSITVRAGVLAPGGHARADDEPDRTTLRPSHVVTRELLAGRRSGAWAFRIGVRQREADLFVGGRDAAILSRGALGAWGVAAEFVRRLQDAVTGPTLEGAIGAAADRWRFDQSSDRRWRVELRAALTLVFALGPRWQLGIRGEGDAGPSFFRADELPAGYRLHPGRAAGVLMEVRRAW